MLKIGVQSVPWYDHNNAEASLEYIKSCGFDAIDFNIDTYLDAKRMEKEGVFPTIFDSSTEEILEYFRPLKDACEKTGVSVCQMHAPFPVYFPNVTDVNEYILMALDKCFAVCEYLCCPAIVVHPLNLPSNNKEDEWEITVEMYRRLIPLLKKYKGVKICTENIFSRRDTRVIEGRLSNAHDCCKMIDQLNEEAGGEYFALCLDVGHANLTGRNIKEFIKEVGSRLAILHIHDNDGHEDLHMLPYTYLATSKTTVCDWKGFYEGLRETGYKGVICFETYRVLKIMPKKVHTEALKLISAIGHYWAEKIDQ